MKFNPVSLSLITLLFSFSAMAQDELLLKSGSFVPEKNITGSVLETFNRSSPRSAGKTFAIIQFEQIPTDAEKQVLKKAGIELLEYIPNKAYTVTITGSPDVNLLNSMKARAFIELQPEQKMEPALARGIYPSWAMPDAETIEVWISFPKSFLFESVSSLLQEKGFQIINSDLIKYRVVGLRLSISRLKELASLPFIEYVQPVPKPDQPLNSNSMYASRANVLKAPLVHGGRDLDGNGVVVGVGDNGDMQSHLDFTGRLINHAGEIVKAHASHVGGTIAGGGIIKELYAGYAPKATIVNQFYSGIIYNSPTYVQDYGMVITNNSYGSVLTDCFYNGLYDITARILDQQAYDMPELQHVFSAGNDGSTTCLPYANSYKTVLGGYQSSKNVLTVGSTDYRGNASTFSARGPVRDGRLKPEIMAQGQFVASTWVNNIYSYNNGTSMAAPGVSGGLALLIQRYRQLNGGLNPKSGLMKAWVCNGGTDKGNAGPDYIYGLGSLNLLRTVEMIENSRYFNGTVIHGGTETHTINVPANTAQLKVLLYWHDPAAALMASKTLVNDLDLEVSNIGNGTILPLVLDTAFANVNAVAVNGNDHINNIEQVVINSPTAGDFTLTVNGTVVTQNPSQEYFLVYDFVPVGLFLTNPVGGEAFVPTTEGLGLDTIYVQWDSYGGATTPFTIELSINNGANWTTLPFGSSVSSSSRIVSWAVPDTFTHQGLMRITKDGTGISQTSGPFSILRVPATLSFGTLCEGYINLNWTAVPGATDYEVMKLQGDEMVSVGTTTALNFTFSGLSRDTTYWVTVRARINGQPGRRASAISLRPNSGPCTGTFSDNDIKVDSILSPNSSGRLLTSTALSNSVPITVRLRNLDDQPSTDDIEVSYSINGGAPVSVTLVSPAADIAAVGFIDYTFTVNEDLSTPGTYEITVTATKLTDPVTENNSLTKFYKQLVNDPITIADLPWIDNFESLPVQSVSGRQMGLSGSDRYDFVNSTPQGRLRTFLNSGVAYSGSKAITLDWSKSDTNAAGNIDSLTGTFNLATFNTLTDDIRIDFRYKNHGQVSHPANYVWIRGDDTDPWIPVYDLFANQNPADGSYKLASGIEVSDSLFAHGQIFTPAFQVKWGQWGEYIAADNESKAGYTFDDIRIYRVIDDIQVLAIDTPSTIACGLGAIEDVRVIVRNTSNSTINNIPIFLRVDGNIAGSALIPTIPASSTIEYTFTGLANLSATGNHLIEVWVEYGNDTYPENDTARATINNLPFINTFPYLENFETSNASWYAGGLRSTWEYGTPVSPKISRAASGNKAWKTKIAGYYNDNEFSYLYSPCFDLSSMTNPTLSFSLSMNIEDCGEDLCDAAWVEYSADGQTWSKLGSMGQGTNWYNKNYDGNEVWSQENYTRWHVATTALPLSNNSNIRIRFVFKSDGGLSKDGAAIDDIHIYDNIYGIYDGVTMTSPVMQSITGGNSQVDFLESGKLVASIIPNNQNMGNTNARAYIHTGATRSYNGQFYHNRNITIKPDPALVNLADSVTVRFYFLDTETESLISATGCSNCTKPVSAYDLGVSKYSDANDAKEDGDVLNSFGGNWLFINAATAKKIPFDKGYYAEFKVREFSEFWLNNGGLDNNHPLPVELISFTATKTANEKDVKVSWRTASEENADRFEVELARGNGDMQQNIFHKIGTLPGQGNSSSEQLYNFLDNELNKTGVRYYRLKMIDLDGSFTYSATRPVLFSNEVSWQVYPNPSSGLFNLVYQGREQSKLDIRVYDASGRVVYISSQPVNGFIQKIPIDLGGPRFAPGLYQLEAVCGDQKQSFRVIKQ